MTILNILVLSMALYFGCMQAALDGGKIRQLKAGRSVTAGGVTYVGWDDATNSPIPAGAAALPAKAVVNPSVVPVPAQPGALPANVMAACQQVVASNPAGAQAAIDAINALNPNIAAYVNG